MLSCRFIPEASMRRPHRSSDFTKARPVLLAVGVGLAASVIGYSMVKEAGRNRVAHRPADDAPARTARQPEAEVRYTVGRTITINRPRPELFAFWHDFSNLSQFMQGIEGITVEGDVAHWQIAGPMGRKLTMETRIVDVAENERLSWKSTPTSQITMEGRILFRDAPAGRGTELEAELSYKPALGEVGRLIGKVFQTDPLIQGRRELRRFKMLMEAGEIATNQNHRSES